MARRILATLCIAAGLWGLAAAQRVDQPAADQPVADQAAAQDRPADGPAPGEPAVPVREARIGRLIRIESPITDRVEQRVRRVVNEVLEQAKRNSNEWPVLIFEIRPGPSDFGKALDLARYLSGPALGGATTVAYLPEDVTGHAVLVAMACEQIVMAAEAKIGDAGAGEGEGAIEPAIRGHYVTVANRRKTIPTAIALAMLDPDVAVYEVETEVSREFAIGQDLDELRRQKAIKEPKLLVPAGEAALFSGAQGRELGFVSYLADDRTAVAKALGLPRESMDEDPSIVGGWRPVRVEFKGRVTTRAVAQLQNLISTRIDQEGVNFVCLWIDSQGGSLKDSATLANYLTGLNPAEVRTVAYIPNQALNDAALAALACQQIVMHPAARLGGADDWRLEEDESPLAAETMRRIAEVNRYPETLAAAMVDADLAVYQYTRSRDGLTEYLSEAEAAEQLAEDQWRQGGLASPGGERLLVAGEEADRLGLAWRLAADFGELKRLYGLEDDPALLEPGWADFLISTLNTFAASAVLLAVGFWAMYYELQSPGMGLGAFLAGLCFLLFFWSHYLNGTAGWLEVLLFTAGIMAILLEVFVLPGFGVFGLGGGGLIVLSLVLASQTFYFPRTSAEMGELQFSLGVVAAAGVGVLAGAILMHRFLPHTPFFNRVMVAPLNADEMGALGEREALAAWSHLVGKRGKATTQLTPAGKGRFDGQLVDVVSAGELIELGSTIEVIEVHGNRVVVTEASDNKA